MKKNLTELKKELLNDIKYYTERNGEYVHIKNYVEKLYSELFTPIDIINAFNELVEEKVLIKEQRKIRYQGGWASKTIYAIDEAMIKPEYL